MSKNHFPKRGDKVNDTRRVAPYMNGFVVRVLFTDDGPEEVMVKYDNETVFYDYVEFQYTWTDRYGGAFILHKENFC